MLENCLKSFHTITYQLLLFFFFFNEPMIKDIKMRKIGLSIKHKHQNIEHGRKIIGIES